MSFDAEAYPLLERAFSDDTTVHAKLFGIAEAYLRSRQPMPDDDLDAFPLDPTETRDSDGDGFGDNLEIAEGTDPFDANDQPY